MTVRALCARALVCVCCRVRHTGIKGVVFCASHPMEPLWGSDGLSYHTLVVSPAIEPSKTLSSELHAALNFIKAHKPALICSSCPTLPALVVAAYSHKESGGRIPIRAALASTQSALGIHPSEVRERERETESRNHPPRHAPSTPAFVFFRLFR